MAGRNRCPRWSELQGDLLEVILEKLDLADHARFASVCSPWRSVAVENPPINKHLYMALSDDPENLVHRFITSFVPSWREAQFIGAGLDGWLVILIDGVGRDLFLLNKAFNSIIPLPPPPRYPKSLIDGRRPLKLKAVLSSPPLSSSSGECTVYLMNSYEGVFYYRLGSDDSDPRFTMLSGSPKCHEDILFYKGRLYVLSYPNTIIIFDHLLHEVSKSSLTCLTDYPTPRRLVDSGNNISYVAGEVGQLHQYSVFTLEGSEPRVVPGNNIDDNFLLLLSRYCSLSITTKEHKEFRRDTNYFEDGDSTFVLDTSEDHNKAKAGDPWPLFFIMFIDHGIKNPATLLDT